MPFTNAHHGPDARRAGDARLDLASRIEAELRARIEDAVDYACLDAMVRAREASGAAAPVADDPRDRDEYTRRVRAFVERVRARLVAGLTPEQRTRLGAVVTPPAHAEIRAALDAQVALARELPDYWQRFDEIRREPGDDSGRHERRGLIDRLLGR